MGTTLVPHREPSSGDLIIIEAGRAVKLHDGEGRHCGSFTVNKETPGMLIGRADNFDWNVYLPTLGVHAYVSGSAFEVV